MEWKIYFLVAYLLLTLFCTKWYVTNPDSLESEVEIMVGDAVVETEEDAEVKIEGDTELETREDAASAILGALDEILSTESGGMTAMSHGASNKNKKVEGEVWLD